MALEAGTYISDLVVTNPTSTDPKSAGDDHLRLVKSTLKATFPNVTGAMTATHTELNYMVGATTNPAMKDGSNLTTPALGDSSTKIATTAFVAGTAFASSLPAQTGNADKFVTTNGTTASWAANLKDGTIRFANSSDTTKLMAFSLSGITTGTTRTVTVPDKSGTMAMTSDLTAYFQSADQTITAAGSLTLAHGLGKTPTQIQTFLKAVNAVLNYSVGDITPALGTLSSNQGAAITADATNIYVRFGSNANTFGALNKTTGAAGALTNTDWSFIVRAWA